MAWIFLVLAGCFEVVGVIGMNKVTERKCFSSFAVLIVGFLLSFGLLSLALRTLPLGMSYAIWTGIGSVGATLVGMISAYGDCTRQMWKAYLLEIALGHQFPSPASRTDIVRRPCGMASLYLPQHSGMRRGAFAYMSENGETSGGECVIMQLMTDRRVFIGSGKQRSIVQGVQGS